MLDRMKNMPNIETRIVENISDSIVESLRKQGEQALEQAKKLKGEKDEDKI